MKADTLLTHIHKIEGWLTDHEAMLLYLLAQHAPAQGEIVEIGCWKGKSTVCLALGAKLSGKPGNVWAVDPHKGTIVAGKIKEYPATFTDFLKTMKTNHVEDIVKPVKKTSVGAAKYWRKPIRLLFVDGLHDYPHAREDFLSWSPLMAPNGIIAFHDGFCGEKGVWKVIRELCFSRPDITNIGSVGSVLFVMTGSPTLLEKIRVFVKKQVVFWSYCVQTSHLPWSLELLIIHKLFRLFLLTRYAVAVHSGV